MAKTKKHHYPGFPRSRILKYSLYTLFFLALMGAAMVVFTGVRRNFGNMVLGESSFSLAPPQGVTVGNYFCKNNTPWATISWNSIEGANSYRLKFYDTAGKMLHSEMVETVSKTTEMYAKFDTVISVQSWRREKREGKWMVMAESRDSEKVRITASGMQAVCGLPVTNDGGGDHTPTAAAVKVPAEHNPTGIKQKEAVLSGYPTVNPRSIDELGAKVARLEKENEQLKAKQNKLELMIERLMSAFKSIIHF